MVEVGLVEELRRVLSVADFGVPAASSPESSAAVSDGERVDAIRVMEELKCALEAAQAELAADLDASVRAGHAAAGIRAERQGRGVAMQVGLARRESHHKGGQHLALATVTRRELPHTRAAWRAGQVSEWRVTIIARETACLTLRDRQTVDATIAGDPDKLEAMGDRELAAAVSAMAYELDPAAFVERRRRAEGDRNVTLRPAPDVMSRLSALLPVKDGVAVIATLTAIANALVAAGDGRSRGQIMADILVDRLTGRSPADGQPPAENQPGVTVDVVVADDVLLGDSHEAADLIGYGPIPADLARELATAGLDPDSDIAVELRRLYADPETGDLVAMDSKARFFPLALALFILLRDRFCRTPWCGAPIRHTDHSRQHSAGGDTTARNGRGLCEACNYAHQAPGWRAGPAPVDRSDPSGRHTIETITPTGHRHVSTAPPHRQRSPGPPKRPPVQRPPLKIKIHTITDWTQPIAREPAHH